MPLDGAGNNNRPSPPPAGSPPPSPAAATPPGVDPGQPTDGRPPDFDAIYAYAGQFIDLGDLIYEYAHDVIGDGMNKVVWNGDRVSAAEAAKEALAPLTTLLAVTDQNAKVPSAARLLWNLGESINWYAINLEEQRAQENKEALHEMIGLLVGLFFGLLLGGLAFLPATAAAMADAMSFLGDVLAAGLDQLFEGVEWLGMIGRGFGDAVVGVGLSLGPQLASTVISEAALHLKIGITSKEIIIGTLLGAAGGVLFGNEIREAAAAAAAEKAATDATAPELGAGGAGGALPKPEPHTLPGFGPEDGGIGKLPKLGLPKPDGLPGGDGLKLPDVPGDGPKFIPKGFNPVKGELKLTHHADVVAKLTDDANSGNPPLESKPPAKDRPAEDTGQSLEERIRALDSGNNDPTEGSIRRSTAADRLTGLEKQLDAARADAAKPPPDRGPGDGLRSELPPPHRRGGGPVAQRPSTADAGENLASRFPDAPVHEPAATGVKDLQDGLVRAGKDATAAGLDPQETKILADKVQSAMDDGRLGEAADHLTNMRDHVDQFQVLRRLDHFREHVDAGHERPAQMGMDKVTWLEKAAAIEKAAAEGRFDDVHTLLSDYEKVAGDHLEVLRAHDQPPAANTKMGSTRTSQADDLSIDQLADRISQLRSDRVDDAGLSPSAHDKLAAKANKVDQALRGDDKPSDGLLGKIGRKFSDPEDAAIRKIESFHAAAEKAEYHAKVEALRKGDSPLPKAEMEKWQKGLDKFKLRSFHERKFMEYYDARLNAYRAETEYKIANNAFAVDHSRPLNDRLDEQLARISKEVRLRAAAEHGGLGDTKPDGPDPSVDERFNAFDKAFETRLDDVRAKMHPEAGSINRENANGRLQTITEQLAAEREDAATGLMDGPADDGSIPSLPDSPDSPPAGTEHDAAGGSPDGPYSQADGSNSSTTLVSPDDKTSIGAHETKVDEMEQAELDALGRIRPTPTHEAVKYGKNELELLLSRAEQRASAAGMSKEDVAGLAGDVRAALDDDRLADAAAGLPKIREGYDKFQIARRLDHFHEFFDGGHINSARLGMDKITWLEHAKAIESAAAEGRFGDLHVELDKFESALETHIRVLKFKTPLESTAEPVPISEDEALQARWNDLRWGDHPTGSREPGPSYDPDEGFATPPEDAEGILAGLRKTPEFDQAEQELRADHELADRLKVLRDDVIASGHPTADGHERLSAQADELDKALRGGDVPEDPDQAIIGSFSDALKEADHQAQVEALRKGDSPLPKDEVNRWQRFLDEASSERERGIVADYYRQRVTDYNAKLQWQVLRSGIGPDRSKPLAGRLDENLKGIAKDLLDQNVQENLSLGDRLRWLTPLDEEPAGAQIDAAGGAAPDGPAEPVSPDPPPDLSANDLTLPGVPQESPTPADAPARAGEAMAPLMERRAEPAGTDVGTGDLLGHDLLEPAADLPAARPEVTGQTSHDVLKAVFDMHFPDGVRLRGATGSMTGAEFNAELLFTDHDGVGPGWTVTKSSWDLIQERASELGTGGLTLFPANGEATVTFLHNAPNGVIQIFEVGPDWQPQATTLDEYLKTPHVAPAAAAFIDPDGWVHGGLKASLRDIPVPNIGAGPGQATPHVVEAVIPALGDQGIADLVAAVADARPATGNDVLKTTVGALFPDGLTLINARADMPGVVAAHEWLFTDHDGAALGWKATGSSWVMLRDGAANLGAGGVILFPAAGTDTATFLGHGTDGVQVFDVGMDGDVRVTPLDVYAQANRAPVAAAFIHHDGRVDGGLKKPSRSVRTWQASEQTEESGTLMNDDPPRDVDTEPALPSDVKLIADLAGKAAADLDGDQPITGHGLLRSVFDRRFALGVRLKNATGDMPGAQTGSNWLFTDHHGEGPGWKKTHSKWRDVKVAARTLGHGGLTLFPPAGQDTATFLHYGRDEVFRVFEVDVHGQHHVTELDQYIAAHENPPAAVAAIDPCGEVHG